MELTATKAAWRCIALFTLDHKGFITQNECIRQQNNIKVTFDAYLKVILQQASRHFLVENGVIDPLVIAPFTSNDERLKEITHSELQTKLKGLYPNMFSSRNKGKR